VILIEVAAEAGVAGTLSPADVATVTGGGAGTVSTSRSLVVSGEEAAFGLDAPFAASLLDVGGAFDTQAGGHPNTFTTEFVVNTKATKSLDLSQTPPKISPIQDVKDVTVALPAGLVGDPLSVSTCPQYLLAPPGNGAGCPASSVVGSMANAVSKPTWEFSGPVVGSEETKPIFNVTPEHGHPAQFAVILSNQEATLYPSLVHTAAGYVVEVTSQDIPRFLLLSGVKITFFGDPAVLDGAGLTPAAFFTDPVDCAGGSLTTTMYMDSWQAPGRMLANGTPDLSDPNWLSSSSSAPAPTGCQNLVFGPEIEARPTTRQAGAPSGLNVELKIPQNSDPSGLGTPELKEATVVLPKGVLVSASQANGLQACSDEQFAAETTELATCPEASQVGTVTVHTPILANPLEGQVFLGAPECDPCTEANGDPQSGRMVRLFIEVHSDEYGVTLKIPGRVALDPATGQLTATFSDLPQQPFSEMDFQFKSGPRAPLSAPGSCGSYSSSVDLKPWSSPYTADAVLSPSFEVSEGCSAPGFAPSFSAGTVSNQADSFSPFTATFSRTDEDQDLSGIQVQTPPGLLAMLSSVPLCGEAQANAGTCPAASQIGHTTAAVGPGPDPFYVPEEGQPQAPVYLTSGYKGAPFGLSIVVPAIAGPFNLGTVVVRAAISVDRSTAQATITSNPLPQSLDGIPLQIKTVNVTIDRPGFMFNPTSCDALAVNATVVSAQNTPAAVSNRFQAANCAGLPFKPKFSASAAGRASKGSGASLDVKISAKGGPQAGGGEANIRAVKVDLPKQLPSRLSTLNKACLAKVFEVNPANCPKESDVGTATATTPVLAHPLSGPAYLVSYGGAKFPDLEIVLQGEGIVFVLDGQTDIKKGITSNSFATVPDAPISSFELKLPTGKFSVLTAYVPQKANYSLCGQVLSMPTMITAQNGVVIKQTTKIGVTGCPKAKVATKKKAKTTKK